MKNLQLSGWGTKDFTEKQYVNYIRDFNPKILEISKDFVDGEVSIKNLKIILDNYIKDNSNSSISFAGTTNFVSCSNLPFNDYLEYLYIQFSQAKFIKSSYFRIIVGCNDNNSDDDIIFSRIMEFRKIISPMKLIIEIHGGWESSINILKYLIQNSDILFIIDFQNLLESKLSIMELETIIENNRIAYFHTRNIDRVYNEHQISLEEEKLWRRKFPNKEFLWEPKKIINKKINDIFYEYKNTD